MSPLELFLSGIIVTILTTAFGIMAKKIVALKKYNRRLKVYIATTCMDKADGLEAAAAVAERLKALLLSEGEEG